PQLPDDRVVTAVQAATSLPSPPLPVLVALAALAERLAAPARRAALLPRLEDIRGLYPRTLLLEAVAPALTEAERRDRFSAALDAMAAASEPMRAVTLEEIAKELPADLFGRAIELATGIEHRWGQAQAL